LYFSWILDVDSFIWLQYWACSASRLVVYSV